MRIHDIVEVTTKVDEKFTKFSKKLGQKIKLEQKYKIIKTRQLISQSRDTF